eukprot:TRINITY_DN4404_c0_g1_i1.p1 TRINITY_DN4404_c0_g1~~TRINITY_DN4404_c0_g1_i1.p1  ORF type:complete len:1028 (+),score=280.35 TRINITY_DN4404_c0_g1_i1:43-3126(+)
MGGCLCAPAEDAAVRHDTLPALFERALRQHADAPAVDDGGTVLSYAALHTAALRVSAGLGQELEGRRGPVALCVEEGADLVVLMLGIVMAGCSIVPVDLRWPPRRRAAVVLDTGAVLAVLPDRAAGTELGVKTVLVPDLRAAPGDARDPASDDLAWMITTSGTTGKPKVVQCTHRAACAYVAAKTASEQLGPLSRVCLASHFTFDPCAGDVFAALAAGACLVVGPSREAVVADLPGVIARSGATHCLLTPTHWSLAEVHPDCAALVSSLTHLSVGGERMPPSMRDRWCDRVQLRNTYGVTEATGYQTAKLMSLSSDLHCIGSPLLGCTAVIVRIGSTAVVEDGEEGEIALGGDSLSIGYAGNVELTRAKFRDGLYLTGDRGRVSAGELQLLGRLDAQVKVRGVRIELEEVDHVLSTVPCVRAACSGVVSGSLSAVVVPMLVSGQDPRDAYAACTGDALAAECVREAADLHCKSLLPAAFVPSRIGLTAAVRLQSTGKADRGQMPVAHACDSAALPTEPVSPLEAAVYSSWREVLGDVLPPEPNSNASFVRMGGDSLSALRAMRWLRRLVRSPDEAAAVADSDEVAGMLIEREAPPGAVCLLSETLGPLAPCELLARPTLADFAAFLADSGVSLLEAAEAPARQLERAEPRRGCVPSGVARALVASSRRGWDLVVEALLSAARWGDVAWLAVMQQALHAAADGGSGRCVELLLAGGASPYARQDGASPAHIAAARRNVGALRPLLQAGGLDVLRQSDASKQTVLTLAARAGCADSVRQILSAAAQHGALVAVRDRADGGGRTATGWAAVNGNADALDVLREYGAAFGAAAKAVTGDDDEATGRVKKKSRTGFSGTVAARKERREDEAIERLVRKVRELGSGGDEKELCDTVETLRSLVCAVRRHRLIALRMGAVGELLRLLDKGPGTVAAQAAGTLRNLLHEAEGRQELLRADDGVGRLRRCLECADSTDQNTAWRAAAAVTTLSLSEESWEPIARSGAVPVIAALAGRKLSMPEGLLRLDAQLRGSD